MAPWIPVALPPRFAAARQVRIVGRRYELEVMETVWERVVQGHGQVVLLGGEPGAGKSRLAAELAGALHDRDVAVLVGNATKDAGVPYQPFVEMLDQLFLAADPGSLTDVLGDGGADLRRLKTLCVTSYFRAIVSYLVGRPHDLAEAASDLRREARPTGQAWHNYFAGCLAQGRAFLGGDFAQAEQWAERTLRLGDAFGVDTTDGSYGVQMFMIRRETGGLDVARRHLTGQASFAGRWIPGLLALYTELDIAEGTRRTLRHLLDRDLASHTTEAQWPIELAFMTEGALALGDRAAAGVLRPFLDAYAGMNLVGGQFVAVFGSADPFPRAHRRPSRRPDGRRAALRRGAGDGPPDGVGGAHRRDARGSRPGPARGGHRPEPSPGSRGAGSGVGRADRSGAGPSATRGAAPLPRPPPAHGQGGGGHRAARRGSEQPGDRRTTLHQRQHTAANHIRSILMKTGAANRTQAARYAAEHGLV
jgi:energy-coupling factor transporter ATP-binding protein EcfA2